MTELAEDPRPMRASRLRTRAEAGAESTGGVLPARGVPSVDSAEPTSMRSAIRPPTSMVVSRATASENLSQQRRRGSEHEQRDQDERDDADLVVIHVSELRE